MRVLGEFKIPDFFIEKILKQEDDRGFLLDFIYQPECQNKAVQKIQKFCKFEVTDII